MKLLILGFRNFEIWKRAAHNEIPKSLNQLIRNHTYAI
jgi:hypothetical protein